MKGYRVGRNEKSSRFFMSAKCEDGTGVPSASQRSTSPRIANCSTVRG